MALKITMNFIGRDLMINTAMIKVNCLYPIQHLSYPPKKELKEAVAKQIKKALARCDKRDMNLMTFTIIADRT